LFVVFILCISLILLQFFHAVCIEKNRYVSVVCVCVCVCVCTYTGPFTTMPDKVAFFFFFFLRRYNFRKVLAFSMNSFHLGWFLMQSLQSVIFIFVISLFTSSSHLFLGLPSDLVSAGDHSYTFFYHAIVWHMVYMSKPG